MTGVKEPLILTVRIDQQSQAFFDAQRQRYFPPERNFLKAHLTLFHQLPDVSAYLRNLQFDSFSMNVTGLKNLGGGVAYRIESEELTGLRGKLAEEFESLLIPQDRQGFRPHIVIQNKVSPTEAKHLIVQLQDGFQTFEVQAIGLDLWTYLGGPWRHENYFAFNTT